MIVCEMSTTRHVVEKQCKRVLGSVDESVVDRVVSGIKLRYDKEDIIARLQPKLDDKSATKLVEKVLSANDHPNSEQSEDSSTADNSESEPPKRSRFTASPNGHSNLPMVADMVAPKRLTPDEIQRMMSDAKKWLEEKKQKIGPTVPGTSSVAPNAGNAVTPATDQTSALARAAELRNRINSALGSGLITPSVPVGAPGVNIASGMATPGGFLSTAKGLATPIFPGIQTPAFLGGVQSVTAAALAANAKPKEQMPGPLLLDDEGQTVNATTGEKLALTPRLPTLKANIRAKKHEEFKQLLSSTMSKKESSENRSESSPHFDPRVDLKPSLRQPRRNFKFHEAGKFEAMAKKIKMKAQLEKLHSEISDAAKRTGIQAAVKLALVQPKVEHKEGVLPQVEWWDGVLLPNNTYDDCRRQGSVNKQGKVEKYNTITHLVEHPTQVKSPDEETEIKPLKLHLTKKEQKKFRRQRRREEEKERTEKIRLGLLPPPEPKVKISNLMRVLGNDAIQDPTKVEAHVKAQMAKRQRAHELANASRKLTDEQRRKKKIEKMKEDITTGVNVAVYRLNTLFNPSHKFKVVENAKQYLMTGVAIITEDIVVVIVEGGPKQQKKFKNLMLRRIQWKEDLKKRSILTNDEKTSEALRKNKCDLVWEGVTKYRSFPQLKPKMFQSVSLVRDFLKRLNVEHYWELAHAESVLDSSDS
ncbi:U4/U6 small nuclear ribonucleoprotein Prp3-like isoform X1 [Convolutriloba macropyga]|uniref:U4/U6 small nuclear ribonucleoprotein Prp3-like isoform X1 n=2 Tax=Convolutriloba macropyga TaxID=536237 RepID=UPI003F52181F